MDDDRTLAELADGQLDDVDAATLAKVHRLYADVDPVPADLAERVHFALALDEMFDEAARLPRLPVAAIRAEIEAARGDYWDGRPQRSAVRLRSLRARVDRLRDDSTELVEQRARLVTSLAAVEFETSGRLDAAMRLLAEAEVLTEQSDS